MPAQRLKKTANISQPLYFERVYEVVNSIPFGRITSYGAIADFLALGSARMVGWALRNLIFMEGEVPAYRVLNRNGELTGRHHFPTPNYMQTMLESEGIEIENYRVKNFKKYFWHPAEELL